MEKFDLVRFTDNDFELEVRADSENETVWLTQDEMGLLFGVDRTRITRHINNIIKDEELNEKSNVRKTHFANSDRPVKLYSLDMIISVGYRVNSKRGIIFRQWANKVLRDYLVRGYVVNQKRLDALNKTIDIQNRMLAYSLNIDKEELSKVINEYTRALDLLDSYDHQNLAKPKGEKSAYVMSYQEVRDIIDSMKFNEMSNVFGVEKEQGKLNGIIESLNRYIKMCSAENYIHQSRKIAIQLHSEHCSCRKYIQSVIRFVIIVYP